VVVGGVGEGVDCDGGEGKEGVVVGGVGEGEDGVVVGGVGEGVD